MGLDSLKTRIEGETERILSRLKANRIQSLFD